MYCCLIGPSVQTSTLLVTLVETHFRSNKNLATNGEVDISHENTTMVVWIYDGV